MAHQCFRKATCNCGVAVKSGDTVFITEGCGSREGGHRLHVVIYKYGHEMASHMRVFSSAAGNGFNVSTHSVNRGHCSRVHYSGVIINAMTSKITGVSNVCSNVCSGADQRKHQSFASLAFAAE